VQRHRSQSSQEHRLCGAGYHRESQKEQGECGRARVFAHMRRILSCFRSLKHETGARWSAAGSRNTTADWPCQVGAAILAAQVRADFEGFPCAICSLLH
jgi:hypothetical protein